MVYLLMKINIYDIIFDYSKLKDRINEYAKKKYFIAHKKNIGFAAIFNKVTERLHDERKNYAAFRIKNR